MLRQRAITAPAIEPVTLDELREHTLIEHAFDDSYLRALILRARKRFELATGRILVVQTWEAAFQNFSRTLVLPKTPIQTIESISVLQNDGSYLDVNPSVYRLALHGLLAEIQLNPLQSWPGLPVMSDDAILVRYTVGHATPTVATQTDGDEFNPNTPRDLGGNIDTSTLIEGDSFELAKQAIMILAAHWYANRENSAPVQLYPAPYAFDAIAAQLSVELP